MLTIYDDASAILWMHGPAESVPHWGELRYPEKQGYGGLAKVGGRLFLIFCQGDFEVAEIERLPGERLVVWLHHGIDFQTDIVPQLRELPKGRPSRAVELALVPLADLPDELPDQELGSPYTTD
ncbi:hypothetical protein [Dongia sp.]|uniref:hypothetical protein n=1 Tax=Dongia sp. TaxID=1977262 RepID=UPI003751176F